MHSLFLQQSQGQNPSSSKECEAISKFLNSKQVVTHFKHTNRYNETLLILIDLNNSFSDCEISSWRDIPITLMKEGALVDSIKTFGTSILRSRSNFYVLTKTQKNNKNLVFIHHVNSNYYSNVAIKKRRNLYYLEEIRYGMF